MDHRRTMMAVPATSSGVVVRALRDGSDGTREGAGVRMGRSYSALSTARRGVCAFTGDGGVGGAAVTPYKRAFVSPPQYWPSRLFVASRGAAAAAALADSCGPAVAPTAAPVEASEISTSGGSRAKILERCCAAVDVAMGEGAPAAAQERGHASQIAARNSHVYVRWIHRALECSCSKMA